MLGVAVPYPEFFGGHNGTCTQTRTLTEVLESTLSDRPIKSWLHVATF